MLVGLVAVVLSVLTAVPASAAGDPIHNTSGWRVVRNSGLPGHMCLADHRPSPFMFGGCTGQYNDQYWQLYPSGQLQNMHTLGCLATHGEPGVFTADCNERWPDQLWQPYDGNRYMLENRHHRGKCLAAHSNGRVFLFSCNKGYGDQYWTADR